MPAILRVALAVPVPQLFDYLSSASGTALPGMRVRVPFGRGSRVGLVVAEAARTMVPPAQLKTVMAVLDAEPLLDGELLASVQWAADYWLGAPGDAFFGALPVALRGGRPLPDLHRHDWALTDAGRAALAADSRRGRSRALLAALADGPVDAAMLDVLVPEWRPAARRLERAALLERCAHVPVLGVPDSAPPLTPDQQAAVAAVSARGDAFGAFVLDGVTGSGKTEVYLTLIQRTLAAGRQALLLVPEIGLAPQTLRRLSQRLGVAVEVLHSRLAAGDRARAWLRARSGQARVIVGTRSAVFTPLPHAGLVIVDEEHDTSYKQQEGFRYHARDLAVVRARALDVPVLLGSATPSLETLANVAAGRYQRLRLGSRPRQRPVPQVRVLDLRGPRLEHGLSPTLLAALDACIERNQQALVFRNRRGFAAVLMCHACGWHAACARCDKPLTVHAARARLVCHHCDHQQPAPARCPQCDYTDLHRQGFGTERLEQALQARYPTLPVIRVDSETTRRRDAFERLLEPLARGGAAILVGTQMLAKGHDLPGLTLVAISSIDEGLYSVDFRASERLAQLIVQVGGRAGRADQPGTVMMQTHYPQHPLLMTLLQQGYGTVAAQLLDERRALQLPPFAHQALVRAQAPQLAAVDAFLAAAVAILPTDLAGVRVRGPLPAPMPRRAGQHRGQLLLEADARAALRAVLVPWHAQLHGVRHPRALRWSLDVDPVDLY